MSRQHRTALTLLEMVIVLAILGVLTLAAVLATETVVDQARYDVTLRTLDTLQTAVLGPTNQRDAGGELVVTGFLADNGTLPRAVTVDPATALAELYSTLKPNRLVSFQAWPTSDSEIKLFAGWRGPYLRIPTQSALVPSLLDGWGNPFAINGGTFAVNDQIVAVQSAGGTGSPYIGPLPATPLAFPIASTTATLVGSIEDADPSSPATRGVRVRVFVPDATLPAGVREFFDDLALGVSGFSFPNTDPAKLVPVGTIAIRAYTLNSGGTDIDTAKPKSPVKFIRVPAGGPPTVTLRFDIQ